MANRAASSSNKTAARYLLLSLLALQVSVIGAQAQSMWWPWWWFFPRPRTTTTSTLPPRTTTTVAPPPPTATVTRTTVPVTTTVPVPTATRTTTAPATSTSATTTAAPSPTSVPSACPNGVRTRRPYSALSQAERSAYATAVNNMFRSGAWSRMTVKHRQGMQYHGTTQFLPMHRALLLEFEDAVLAAAGGALSALPYWDELADRSNPFGNTALWSTSGIGAATSGALTAPFTGLRDDSGRLVTRAPSRNSGQFNWLPSNQLLATAIRQFTTYGELSNTIEVSPHNQYHVLVGGQMSQVSNSPSDPIFWLHHAYTDMLWATWQAQSATNFVDLTTGAGDIRVTPDAPTVLYEDRYTNRDMLYYRQRLCYEYATLPGANGPAMRAQRALQDLEANTDQTSTLSSSAAVPAATSTPTSSATSTETTSTSSSAAAPSPTLVTPPIPANNGTAPKYVPEVESMPEDAIVSIMPMMEPAKAIARVREAEATLNRICAKLNEETAAKVEQAASKLGVPAHEAAKVVIEELPKVSDLVHESRSVVATIQDDYKDTKIPAVKEARKVLVDSQKGTVQPPQSGAERRGAMAAVVALAAAAAAAMAVA